MRAAIVLAKAAGLRDLRGRLVLPRLLCAVAVHAAERAARRSIGLLAPRPAKQISEFLRGLHEHRENSEIALAGLQALVALLHAFAILLIAIAALVLALSRL